MGVSVFWDVVSHSLLEAVALMMEAVTTSETSRQSIYTRLHGATSHETVIFTLLLLKTHLHTTDVLTDNFFNIKVAGLDVYDVLGSM
jgi:hypothetical protein